MSCVVRNMDDPDWEGHYDLPPREAVACAYAQYGQGDWSTWDYQAKYAHLVYEGKYHYYCGKYAVAKEKKP